MTISLVAHPVCMSTSTDRGIQRAAAQKTVHVQPRALVNKGMQFIQSTRSKLLDRLSKKDRLPKKLVVVGK